MNRSGASRKVEAEAVPGHLQGSGVISRTLIETKVHVASIEDMERILRTTRRVAVLGAKPDSRIEAAGH